MTFLPFILFISISIFLDVVLQSHSIDLFASTFCRRATSSQCNHNLPTEKEEKITHSKRKLIVAGNARLLMYIFTVFTRLNVVADCEVCLLFK